MSYYRVFRDRVQLRRRAREVRREPGARDKSTELGRDEFMAVITMTDYVQMASPFAAHKRGNTTLLLFLQENPLIIRVGLVCKLVDVQQDDTLIPEDSLHICYVGGALVFCEN